MLNQCRVVHGDVFLLPVSCLSYATSNTAKPQWSKCLVDGLPGSRGSRRPVFAAQPNGFFSPEQSQTSTPRLKSLLRIDYTPMQTATGTVEELPAERTVTNRELLSLSCRRQWNWQRTARH